METDIALPYEVERNPDSLQRLVILIGLGYAALVGLAFYVDYKIQLRRARKRRESKQDRERFTAQDRAWFRQGEDDPPPGN